MIFAVEDLLTPEQRAIRDAVREFVDGEIMPNMRDRWDRHEFPEEIIIAAARSAFSVRIGRRSMAAPAPEYRLRSNQS